MKRISQRELVKTAADKPGKGFGKIEEKRTSDKQPHYVWSYTFEDPDENSGYPVTSQRIHRTREDAQVALDHFIRSGIVNKPDGSTYHYEKHEKPKAQIGTDESYKPISQEDAEAQAAEALSAPAVYLDRHGKPRKPNKKSEGLTYEEWEKRLSALISSKFGLSMEDFPDWNSMDAYEDDMSVAEGFLAFKEEQGDLDGF